MLKRDGSVSIHSDNRAYKPLNWMLTPCEREEFVGKDGLLRWVFVSKKDELEIVFHEIFSDINHEWDDEEPGLVRQWTESDLQLWISENIREVFGKRWSLVGREYPTGAGPVDLLVKDPKGKHVAVEVKRMAHLPAIDQVLRYVESLESTNDGSIIGPVRGIVVALEVKSTTKELGMRRGVECITVTPPR